MKQKLLFLVVLSLACLTITAADWDNRSGTIAVGAASQELAPSNNSATYFFFQNISADTLWINNGVTAVQDQPSIKIVAGASYEPIGYHPKDAWYVIGPNAGAKFVCKVK